MKRLIVRAYQVALVYKNGALEEVFTKGYYWLGWGRDVVFYDVRLPFEPKEELAYLLKNEKLAAMLKIVNVKDNELTVRFKNGNFYDVLVPRQYAFWKEYDLYSLETLDLSTVEVDKAIDRKLLHQPQVFRYLTLFFIDTNEKGLLFIDGEFQKVLESGTYYFWKGERTVSVKRTDVRKQILEVNGQELLTKDKANIRLNLQGQYRITDEVKALVNTKDVHKQLYQLMQLGLREYIGQMTLDELLAAKSTVADYVMNFAKSKAEEMGAEIFMVGIRDVILPGDVKEIMNQVLIAEKRAQANVIMRREETASTRSLLNTAKLMENNDMLFRLKEMEYVEKIADKISTITLSGGGQLVDQLKDVFGVAGK